MERRNIIYRNKEKISIASQNYSGFNIASFDNEKQKQKFFKKMGIESVYDCHGQEKTSKVILDGKGFYKKKDIPKGAKKIKALSNGSIVDCYVKKDKDRVTIYRPNPNSKKVYKPLKTKKHIKFQKKYGTY